VNPITNSPPDGIGGLAIRPVQGARGQIMDRPITPQGLSPAQDVEESLGPLSLPALEEQILQRLRSRLGDGLPDKRYRSAAKHIARFCYTRITAGEGVLASEIAEERRIEEWVAGWRRADPEAA